MSGVGVNEDVECTLSTIDSLHTDTPIQRQIMQSEYTTAKPIAPVRGSTEIEFSIENNGQSVIDLYNSELEIAFRVLKPNGAVLSATDKVACINYIGATMFDQVDLWLNQESVSQRAPNYAFRAVVETLLNYGKNDIPTWLESGAFYSDTPGQMDNADPIPAGAADPRNAGLVTRHALMKESHRVVTNARLHLDMFLQGKPLVNGVPMRLKFHRNKDAYCLMSSEEGAAYKIEILDMTLYLRKVRLADDVYNAMVLQPVQYPITRVDIREHISGTGVKNWNVQNLVKGVLPTKIVVGLVASAAANGHYKRNPFNFAHVNLSKLELMVDGAIFDGSPLEFDFSAHQYMDGFRTLARGTGKKYRDESTMIGFDDFEKGFALFAFDLSPSLCDGQYKDPPRSGDVSLALTFEENITEPLTLCVYLQYDSKIVINKAKEVTTFFQT